MGQAFDDLGRLNDFRYWAEQKLEPAAFGHSLGGLLALSLPSAYRHRWRPHRAGDDPACLADRLVPSALWATAKEGLRPNFKAIASSSKALLFSWANAAASPPLVAFHNQAVTSNAYDDDALFRSFGGVKHRANAYNTQYIWPALQLLLSGEASPQDLLERLCPCDFQVQPLPPVAGVSPPGRC